MALNLPVQSGSLSLSPRARNSTKEENMFKRKELNMENAKTNGYEKDSVEVARKQKTNAIVRGSKLTGDIKISYDLELSGEVDGNIISDQNSNIKIKGTCNGNIITKGGNVEIEGELRSGDIIAGGDVKITGKFNGGRVKAKGKIYLNGEFTGKLEGNEIEAGPDTKGKGEFFYKEYISIAKGAKIEVSIIQTREELKEIKKTAELDVVPQQITLNKGIHFVLS